MAARLVTTLFGSEMKLLHWFRESGGHDGGCLAARLVATLSILICGSAAYAEPYGEIRGGLNQLDEISGSGGASPGYSAELFYEQKLGFGAEGGMRGILDTPFAIGLALDGFRTRLESATVSGTSALSPGVPATEVEAEADLEAPTSVSLSAEEVRDLGFNFDDRITILSANAFYELGDEEGLVAGVGFGVAAFGIDF